MRLRDELLALAAKNENITNDRLPAPFLFQQVHLSNDINHVSEIQKFWK